MRALLAVVVLLLVAAPASQGAPSGGRLSPAAWDALNRIGSGGDQITARDVRDPARLADALCGSQPARPADFQVVLVGRICRESARVASSFAQAAFCLRGLRPARVRACMPPALRRGAAAVRELADLDARLAGLMRRRCATLLVRGDRESLAVARSSERLAGVLERGRRDVRRAVRGWSLTVLEDGIQDSGPSPRRVRRACAPRA
ncbi:hypothetical protein [Capillimicrobium parvum]|uniref:Uncharacterized protein n=1 Tax=Capillimicrobium parvum TaxID=2884022 RepID=A0A9E6Y1M2_9ACTN|nr:hypothetical protein [Capillimicrobium parvum]UGS37972.1 hypothetical protein DSM104329_04394 [Capillimicrobium parvum]